MMRPDYKETLKIASKKEKLKKKLRYIFCGWRRNAAGQNVREKILKTRSAFGDAKAEICKRKILVPVGQIVPMKKN